MKINKISIIIVNYNGQKFLDRLIESINDQTYRNFEVLLVDNSSSDNSIDYVNGKYPWVKIIVSGNCGYGHACNIGAKKSEGDCLIFLNEDMYLPNNFLVNMIDFRENIAGNMIGGITCKMVDFDANPEEMLATFGGQIDLFGFPLKRRASRDTFVISGAPFFIERKLFNHVGGFNENIFLYGEDIDLCWRLKIFGYNNYVNHSTYLHHFGGGVTGGFGPRKTSFLVCSSFIPMLTNYNKISLVGILPFYFMYIVILNIGLFIVKTFNIQYNIEIIREYGACLKKINNILKFRCFVQNNRTKSDFFMFKYISFVPAFIRNASYKKLAKNYIIKN